LLRKLLVFLFLCSSVSIAGGAPVQPSGEAVAVVQSTSASGPGGQRTLAPEKPVYSGDTIVTGDIGTAQIQFRDDTRFVVGPNSSVIIDKYIFNPDQSLSAVSLQMTRGAFRFISGNGPKKSYKIDTPTSTIGIRGTQVDIAVGEGLGPGGGVGTAAIVTDGEILLCNKDDERRARDDRNDEPQCIIVPAGCGAAIVGSSGEFEEIDSPRAKEALIKERFPLLEDRQQEDLLVPFRVSVAGCFPIFPTNPAAYILPIAVIGGVTCTAADACISEPASN
jgi:hypothetical protein